MTSENKLLSVYPDIFSGEGETLHLLGGSCKTCSNYQFPKAEVCPVCLGKVEQVSLGSLGSVHSITSIHAKPPLGLPNPYRVAYVDLEQIPLRIFTLMDSNPELEIIIGQRVRLAIAPIGVDIEGSPCLRPYFTTINKGL